MPPEGGLIPPPGGVMTGVELQPARKNVARADAVTIFASCVKLVPESFIVFPSAGAAGQTTRRYSRKS
jgi:hypothetical protein